MNIVYASDDNYADILGVSMVSLFENNRGEETDVYILDDGIDSENKARLLSVGEEYGQTVKFIDVRQRVRNGMNPERWPMTIFSRLYMAELLDSSIDKALYLDCDVIVRRGLSGLYDVSIEDVYAAGVGDCLCAAYRKAIGLAPDSHYFNSGVLLVNLAMWRRKNITARFEEFAEKYKGNVPCYPDQGIINGVISGCSGELSPEYNCCTVLFDFSYDRLMRFRKPSVFYTREQVETAVNDPVIVHFTSSFLSLRPWVQGSAHPFAGEWLGYKQMSPWADIPLREDGRSVPAKMAVWLYRHLPGGLASGLAGFLHTCVKPFL